MKHTYPYHTHLKINMEHVLMEVWKIMFLSKWVISRFHADLPGCIMYCMTPHPSVHFSRQTTMWHHARFMSKIATKVARIYIKCLTWRWTLFYIDNYTWHIIDIHRLYIDISYLTFFGRLFLWQTNLPPVGLVSPRYCPSDQRASSDLVIWSGEKTLLKINQLLCVGVGCSFGCSMFIKYVWKCLKCSDQKYMLFVGTQISEAFQRTLTRCSRLALVSRKQTLTKRYHRWKIPRILYGCVNETQALEMAAWSIHSYLCYLWEKKGTWAESFHPFTAAHMFVVGGDRFWWSKIILRSFFPVCLGWLYVCLGFSKKPSQPSARLTWTKKTTRPKTKKRCLSSGMVSWPPLRSPTPNPLQGGFPKKLHGPSYKVIAAATPAMIHSWSFCFFLVSVF